jgi:acetyl-CoA carboxylase carboxyltransferase component
VPVTELRLRTRAAGTVAAGTARLAGREVAWFETDPGVRGGALGARDAEAVAAAADLARRRSMPLVGVIASSGADVHEGVAALDGWGRAARAVAACSGVVPVLLAVTGPAVSGPALLLGLADLVAMTTAAFAYLTGPDTVRRTTGEAVDEVALGGTAVHARHTGVAAFVADDRDGALDALGTALALLPDSTDAEPPLVATGDPAGRRAPELRDAVPASQTASYDVRRVLSVVVDDGVLVEVRARFAPNLVTALGSIAGRPVGLVANQPCALAGTLDIPASQKGARFVAMCDAFNLPIVTFVDTPGFFPGKDLEWRGMIRHGAQLVAAYAEATVPRVCVVLRKAYGGAYIVMDSKTMGNDVCLAWPSAEIAVMGARGAVAILHRHEPEARRAALEAAYERAHLTPWVAAERGYVDAVVDPADTRPAVAAALTALATKRERLVARKHANGPL